MMQYTQWLDEKKQNGSLRALRNIDAVRREREQAGAPFINLSSNDYLSLGDDADLRKEFWSQQDASTLRMSACSSRLLTGTSDQQEAFERELATAYGAEAALVFGSGYHANQGILPAVCTSRTLILADKLVHASLIDGIRMSEGKCIRFRHNDYAQLEMLVQKHVADYENIIIVTESIFSMDGDACDLPRLVALKKALHHRSGGRFRCRLFDHGLKRLLNDGRRRCGHLRDGRRGRRVGRAHAGGQNEQQRGEKRHVHTEAGMFERQERVHRRCGVRVTGRQTIRNQVCSGTRRCRAERGRGRFHRAITVNTPLGSCRQVIKESI